MATAVRDRLGVVVRAATVNLHFIGNVDHPALVHAHGSFFRAECPCGWTGPVAPLMLAAAHAQAHRANER